MSRAAASSFTLTPSRSASDVPARLFTATRVDPVGAPKSLPLPHRMLAMLMAVYLAFSAKA